MESFCFSHIEDEIHRNRLDGASVYIEGNSSISNRLNAYCDNVSGDSSLPLLVVGPKGAGKSAALAKWTRARHANILPKRGLDYEDFVFYHAIGCSRLSTDLSHLLRRLVTRIISHFELKDGFDLSDEKLPWIFPRLLERASKKKANVIIVIAGGLEHICSRDEGYGLKFLPLRLPPNVKMILSVTRPCCNPPQISDHAMRLYCKVSKIFEEFKRRGWPMINVENLDTNTALAILDKYLPSNISIASRSSHLKDQILVHENALFLTTLLKAVCHVESCLGFKQSEVTECLNIWTSPNIISCRDLIDSMLSVFESGIQKVKHPTKLGSLLSHSLSLLFAARHGLREDELFDLVARVRENVRWKDQTKDTVIPIKSKIVHNIIQKKNRLIDIFRSFDSDGNGTLSREEFYNGILGLLKGATREEVTLLIDEVDNNGDGEIDYIEVLDHFEDILRRYNHGSRRVSLFGAASANCTVEDSFSINDEVKSNLIATLQCLGVVCMNEGQQRIFTIPFECTELRDTIWKRYMRSTKGEAKCRAHLIEYFSKEEPSHRVCEELPWHLKKSSDLTALKKLLSDLRVLDLMFNTEELRRELFVYLLRLSQSKKFDIVHQYNRSAEKWNDQNHPSATQLFSMVAFLAEVMSWFGERMVVCHCENALKTPPFMRMRLTDSQLDKLGLDWMKAKYSLGSSKADTDQEGLLNTQSDYYLLRWIWLQCPWLALNSTSKAIQRPVVRDVKISVPEVISNDLPINDVTTRSRSRALINRGSKVDNIEPAVEMTDLRDAYAKLKELRHLYDNMVVETTDRTRFFDAVQDSLSQKSIGERKHRSQLAAAESALHKLQQRQEDMNEMMDASNRIEATHEQILVILESCQPSMCMTHLELEQQITLSKEQLSDFRRQLNLIDGEINEITVSSKNIASKTAMILEEKRQITSQLEALQLKVKDLTDRKKAQRNASFDPTAFNRRMKLEGIIAKRRQMRGSNENKRTIDQNLSLAPHPMQKIAHAAGSFDPRCIAEKLKSCSELSTELSLRQEKQELECKKKQKQLRALQNAIKATHLSDGKTIDNKTPDTSHAQILFDNQKSLRQLATVISEAHTAIKHLYDIAESIEQQNLDTSQFHFAMDESQLSLYNSSKDLVMHIKCIHASTLGQVVLPRKTKVINKYRVRSKSEESDYGEEAAILLHDDDSKELGRTKDQESGEDFGEHCF